ncbi:MAG: NADH-quinone oxidoreductase subunit L [Verrucomicrobiota bacterium]
MTISHLMVFILITPLLSAGLIALFFRDRGGIASYLSVAASGLVLIFSALVLLDAPVNSDPVGIEWLSLGGFTVSMGFLFDEHTALLLFVVSFVGFWIHLFSLGYMDDDKAKARFFGGLSIFMFSMLGIVLADNLAMIFIFWELVGFSSYMLIAHYCDTDEAAAASKKAFIVNRIGDFGFLLGIVWCFWQFGTLELEEISAAVGLDPSLVSTGMGLLLICGFLGKSAQFPLHVWLPDAMAGPTPISALIHAATMVAAGIFLLVRIDFLLTPFVLEWIAWTGAAMAFFAGLVALGQDDIKKILAYSTLSQLGYMAAAVGIGLPGLALFHLTTHAFFKALLFLCSGSIIHACHHEQDIFKMGGLFRRMPLTSLTFLAGMLALMGANYTAGYWSKEAIMTASLALDAPIFWFLIGGAVLTALYMGRLFLIAFFGKPRSDHVEKAKESGPVMVLPLLVLAVLALVGGFYTYWPELLSASFFSEVNEVYTGEEFHSAHKTLMVWGTVAWVSGLVVAFLVYGFGSDHDRLNARLPNVVAVFRRRLFIDDLYDFYVIKIQQRVADIIGFLDLFLISGVVVRGAAGIAGLIGVFTRSLHVGSVHGYVYWFLLGVVLFWGFSLGWF